MSDTFDLNAFIDGSSYPKQVVDVYTNVAALDKAENLNKQLKNETDLEVGEKLEAELDLVRVDIEKSVLKFTLQGMPFRIAQKIADIFDDEKPATEDQIVELVVKTIVKVEDVNGATTSVPDAGGLAHLEDRLSPREYAKIVRGVLDVNFSAATYEAGIDAGFPVGSTDVE